MFSLKTSGFAEMDKVLRELPRSTARNTARRAMKVALQPVAAAAEAAAPVDQGDLAKSIVISSKLKPSQARDREARETATSLALYVGSSSPLAHLVEFGTGPRYQANGKFVGVMPAQPWFRPAWDGNVGKVLDILASQLRVEIDKTLARAARKAARARG